ncbi:DUF559 domain-containing protein [Neolewinella lacunae]|uniref:DUF559 domain-containing protein n=1 Tax=Neolewinella lacunae TaxID=1517758 RepID=UPI003B005308
MSGKRVRIDELEHRVGDFLCQGVDAENQQATGWLTHWVCNGVKPVFEVVLRSGKRVKMTENHRVLTEDGWRELRDLGVGSFIGTPRGVLGRNVYSSVESSASIYPSPGPCATRLASPVPQGRGDGEPGLECLQREDVGKMERVNPTLGRDLSDLFYPSPGPCATRLASPVPQGRGDGEPGLECLQREDVGKMERVNPTLGRDLSVSFYPSPGPCATRLASPVPQGRGDGEPGLECLQRGGAGFGRDFSASIYPTPGPSPQGRGDSQDLTYTLQRKDVTGLERLHAALGLRNNAPYADGVVTHDYWEVPTAVTRAVYAYAKGMRKAPTLAERIMWLVVRNGKIAGYTFQRQKPMGDCIPDFICLQKRIVVEVDGAYHQRPEMMLSDAERDAKFAAVGYRTIRFTNEEIRNDLPSVIQRLTEAVCSAEDRPLPYPVEVFSFSKNLSSKHSSSAPGSPLPCGEGPGEGSNYNDGPRESSSQVIWDEIISITPAGNEKVYDITVEGIHNYVGNNILLHNCVYQEQVMLLSQKLANFTKGEADTLRKAMGKKQKAVLDKMYPSFIAGGTANGHPEDKLGKIWKDWEAFASYAFNKSHSTCYALVAYQTAYLKAHYPAEYMASVLTHNKSDQTKLTFFLRECKRMDVPVLGPDINESQADFSVNKKGAIRIGMTALKGVGEGPVEAILDARKSGPFTSLFNLLQRIEPGAINKRVLEALVDAGAFDCFQNVHRAQYFAPSEKFDSYLEHVTKYANAYHAQLASAASSLFGAFQAEILPDEPTPPEAKEWLLPEKLAREKEITGVYVSGHPLDGYKLEIDNYVTCSLGEVNPIKYGRSTVRLAGMIVGARHMVSKNGNGWGIFELGDYDATLEFKLFGEDYQKYRHILHQGTALFLTATYRKKWNSEELELNISDVKLLEGVGREMTEAIVLKLPLEDLNERMVVALDDLCQRFPGQQKLRMVFYDREEDVQLKMFSLKRTVEADTDFVREVERLGITYRLESAVRG